MTFKEAVKKLGEIAKSQNEDYHTIGYEWKSSCIGETAKCKLYIHGFTHSEGDTWEEAFTVLDKQINPKTADLTESPE